MTTSAVLGAGSSGHALAGYLGSRGHAVRLWNRDLPDEVSCWLEPLASRGGVDLQGAVSGFGALELVTTNLAAAVSGADVVVVCTTADALGDIGRQLAPLLGAAQALLLVAPGALGSLEMAQALARSGHTGDLLLGETSTTIFGSGAPASGSVHVSGRKRGVEVASTPGGRAGELADLLPELELVAVDDPLLPGLSSIGPSLHVVPMVLNAGRIESGEHFRYYVDGVTPSVAAAVGAFDEERLEIAGSFGSEAMSLTDYLTGTVGAPGGNLYESIQGTPMYAATPAPNTLQHRFLWEDADAGLVPLLTLADIAGLAVPTLRGFAAIAATLLGRPLSKARSRDRLMLGGTDVAGLRALVRDADAFNAWRAAASAV